MLILAVDTATDWASLAVGDDAARLISSHVFEHHRTLSQRLYLGLATVLETAGVSLADIECFAVGVGPGSFTGVRVAVTTMRTLAQATGKRLVAIGTLESYAVGAFSTEQGKVAALLPSRKNEVYAQFFSQNATASPAQVMSLESLHVTLKREPAIVLCGQVDSLPASFDEFRRVVQAAPPPTALISIAASKLKAADFADPLSLRPAYVAAPAISQHKSSR